MRPRQRPEAYETGNKCFLIISVGVFPLGLRTMAPVATGFFVSVLTCMKCTLLLGGDEEAEGRRDGLLGASARAFNLLPVSSGVGKSHTNQNFIKRTNQITTNPYNKRIKNCLWKRIPISAPNFYSL